jgi:SAM-dependent methyltransferase
MQHNQALRGAFRRWAVTTNPYSANILWRDVRNDGPFPSNQWHCDYPCLRAAESKVRSLKSREIYNLIVKHRLNKYTVLLLLHRVPPGAIGVARAIIKAFCSLEAGNAHVLLHTADALKHAKHVIGDFNKHALFKQYLRSSVWYSVISLPGGSELLEKTAGVAIDTEYLRGVFPDADCEILEMLKRVCAVGLLSDVKRVLRWMGGINIAAHLTYPHRDNAPADLSYLWQIAVRKNRNESVVKYLAKRFGTTSEGFDGLTVRCVRRAIKCGVSAKDIAVNLTPNAVVYEYYVGWQSPDADDAYQSLSPYRVLTSTKAKHLIDHPALIPLIPFARPELLDTMMKRLGDADIPNSNLLCEAVTRNFSKIPAKYWVKFAKAHISRGFCIKVICERSSDTELRQIFSKGGRLDVSPSTFIHLLGEPRAQSTLFDLVKDSAASQAVLPFTFTQHDELRENVLRANAAGLLPPTYSALYLAFKAVVAACGVKDNTKTPTTDDFERLAVTRDYAAFGGTFVVPNVSHTMFIVSEGVLNPLRFRWCRNVQLHTAVDGQSAPFSLQEVCELLERNDHNELLQFVSAHVCKIYEYPQLTAFALDIRAHVFSTRASCFSDAVSVLSVIPGGADMLEAKSAHALNRPPVPPNVLEYVSVIKSGHALVTPKADGIRVQLPDGRFAEKVELTSGHAFFTHADSNTPADYESPTAAAAAYAVLLQEAAPGDILTKPVARLDSVESIAKPPPHCDGWIIYQPGGYLYKVQVGDHRTADLSVDVAGCLRDASGVVRGVTTSTTSGVWRCVWADGEWKPRSRRQEEGKRPNSTQIVDDAEVFHRNPWTPNDPRLAPVWAANYAARRSDPLPFWVRDLRECEASLVAAAGAGTTSALDLGCGRRCLALETGAAVSAVDVDPAAVEAARRRGASAHLADMFNGCRLIGETLTGQFDCIVSVHSVHYAGTDRVGFWQTVNKFAAERARLIIVYVDATKITDAAGIFAPPYHCSAVGRQTLRGRYPWHPAEVLVETFPTAEELKAEAAGWSCIAEGECMGDCAPNEWARAVSYLVMER